RVEHGVLELALDRPRVELLQAAGEIVAQLLQRVEAAGLGGEVVVELGQALGLDLGDGHLEGRGLPAEVAALVVLGEGDLDLALLAGARADQLLLEAGNQPARAELEQLIAALSALEWLAVDLADVVDHDVVPLSRGTVHGLERRHAVAQALDL